MTLAAILLVGIFYASAPAAARQSPALQPTTASKPADNATPQDQGTPPAQTPSLPSAPSSSAANPAKTSAEQTRSATAKRSHHKKRVLPANCDNSPPAAGQSASGTTPTPADTAASGTTTPAASNPCPPPKVIVRQGGTSEPSIQLAGGAGGNQASHQKDSANQMLDTTEANLKKIGDHQLRPEQQDMVNQIHQFMDQSKAAVGDGDLERARTLAWKAQLLSEELIKPEK